MTLIYMILMLGIIVFIHEFGHFIFAKKAGIYVYEFSIGMGPRIIKFNRKNDETEYSIRLFPIGGYVQMAGEGLEEDEKIPEDKKMQSKTWMQRFLTVIAGIMFNFILAITLLFVVGLINGAPTNKPYITQVEEGINSNLIKENDKILEVNGKKVIFTDTMLLRIHVSNGKPLKLKVESDGNIKEVTLNPIEVNEDGKTTYKYGIGIGSNVEKGILPALRYAFTKFASLIAQMAMVIGYLFTGKLGISSLSGPVGIFGVVGESAKAGFIELIYLTAFISLNVGFMNVLPIPALDGGRILFLIIEKIKGSKVDIKVENTIHAIGFALLMILMVVVTLKDILGIIK